MKADKIEKELGENTQRPVERLVLWNKIKAAWEDGGPSGVEGLLNVMAASLEEEKSRVSERLAEEMGVHNANDQES